MNDREKADPNASHVRGHVSLLREKTICLPPLLTSPPPICHTVNHGNQPAATPDINLTSPH